MKQFVVYLCCGSPENTLSRNHTTGTHLSLVFWKSTHKISEQYLISPPKIIKKKKSTSNQKKNQINKQKTQTKTPKQTKNLTKNPSKNFKNSRKTMKIQSSWPLFLTWAIRIKVLIKQQFLRRSHAWQGQFCPADPTSHRPPRGNGTERKEIGGVLPGGSSSFGVPERRWLRIGNGTEAKLGQGIPD